MVAIERGHLAAAQAIAAFAALKPDVPYQLSFLTAEKKVDGVAARLTNFVAGLSATFSLAASSAQLGDLGADAAKSLGASLVYLRKQVAVGLALASGMSREEIEMLQTSLLDVADDVADDGEDAYGVQQKKTEEEMRKEAEADSDEEG